MDAANFRPVANHIFVDLPSATQEGYQRASGIFVAQKLSSEQRVEDSAAVIGTVAYLPERLVVNKVVGQKDSVTLIYERIPIDVREGDKVAVDYRVVGDGRWDGATFNHKNCWLVNDKMVWKAESDTLIAVLRGDKWQALGDYALLKRSSRTKYQSSLIIIPDNVAEEEEKGIGLHVSGMDLAEGQKVLFNEDMATPYQFENGEEMLVIRRDFIYGILN